MNNPQEQPQSNSNPQSQQPPQKPPRQPDPPLIHPSQAQIACFTQPKNSYIHGPTIPLNPENAPSDCPTDSSTP